MIWVCVLIRCFFFDLRGKGLVYRKSLGDKRVSFFVQNGVVVGQIFMRFFREEEDFMEEYMRLGIFVQYFKQFVCLKQVVGLGFFCNFNIYKFVFLGNIFIVLVGCYFFRLYGKVF